MPSSCVHGSPSNLKKSNHLVWSVIVGSLATSVTDPWTLLCGASGGCYALIGAHFAKIIMVSLLVFSLFTAFNLAQTWHTQPLCVGHLCEVTYNREEEEEESLFIIIARDNLMCFHNV